MSLWFTLRVNDKAVGSLVIRRISPRGPLGLIPEDVDVVGTYVVQCDGRDLGQVEHRYGDGPWALVRLALGLLEKRLEKRGCAYAAISLVLSHSHYPIDGPAGTYRGRYPGGAVSSRTGGWCSRTAASYGSRATGGGGVRHRDPGCGRPRRIRTASATASKITR